MPKNRRATTFVWTESLGRGEQLRRARTLLAALQTSPKERDFDIVVVPHHGREAAQTLEKDWGGEMIDTIVISHPDVDHDHALSLLPVSRPPQFLEGVFWIVLPRNLRDAIMGDATEAYHQTMERYGSRALATLDYFKEALFAILASLRMSAAQWIQQIFRRSQ